jgi:hypothetical protein
LNQAPKRHPERAPGRARVAIGQLEASASRDRLPVDDWRRGAVGPRPPTGVARPVAESALEVQARASGAGKLTRRTEARAFGPLPVPGANAGRALGVTTQAFIFGERAAGASASGRQAPGQLQLEGLGRGRAAVLHGPAAEAAVELRATGERTRGGGSRHGAGRAAGCQDRAAVAGGLWARLAATNGEGAGSGSLAWAGRCTEPMAERAPSQSSRQPAVSGSRGLPREAKGRTIVFTLTGQTGRCA